MSIYTQEFTKLFESARLDEIIEVTNGMSPLGVYTKDIDKFIELAKGFTHYREFFDGSHMFMWRLVAKKGVIGYIRKMDVLGGYGLVFYGPTEEAGELTERLLQHLYFFEKNNDFRFLLPRATPDFEILGQYYYKVDDEAGLKQLLTEKDGRARQYIPDDTQYPCLVHIRKPKGVQAAMQNWTTYPLFRVQATLNEIADIDYSTSEVK